jgi:hypothetical protein
MIDVNFLLVTYDKLLDRALDNLSNEELSSVSCYAVQKKTPKNISSKITKTYEEWNLPWNDFSYQTKQYYEYGTIIHLYKNQNIITKNTHIGLLHYDVLFEKNSIKDICTTLQEDHDTIFYQMIRPPEQMSLLDYEFKKLCEFMSIRLDVLIDPDFIKQNGWISESLSVTPKEVFLKFGEFLFHYGKEIETILKNNVWGIMNHCPHRICGIIERMWGFYLMSLPNKKKQMNIIHDWYSYDHHHMNLNGTGAKNL